MDSSFTRESLGLLMDNNLRIYNDDTEDLSVRDVAINNLTSFINELLELNIIETETIEEFEDSWTNYHETILDEIIDAHVAQQEFESTQLSSGVEFDENEVEGYNDFIGLEEDSGIVPENDDVVNFNQEESSGFSNSLDSSDAFDEH